MSFGRGERLGTLGAAALLLVACGADAVRPSASQQPRRSDTPVPALIGTATPSAAAGEGLPPTTLPDWTATPAPAATSEPTSTSTATSTPEPTDTATATPEPTDAATNTPTAESGSGDVEQTSTATGENPLECDNIQIDEDMQRQATEALRAQYEHLKQNYVTTESLPEGQARTLYDPPEKTSQEFNTAVMEMAVRLRDKDTFDALWQYTRSYRNDQGLPSWLIGPNGPEDFNSAFDSDIKAAGTLEFAVTENGWTEYEEDARSLAAAVMDHSIDSSKAEGDPTDPTFLPKGGTNWGGPDQDDVNNGLINTSHHSPNMFYRLQDFTGDERWGKVAEASRRVLDNVMQQGWKLPPNWVQPDGESANGDWYRKDEFAHEAARVAYEQMIAAREQCHRPDVVNHALKVLRWMDETFSTQDPNTIAEGYDAKSGEPTGPTNDAPAFVGSAFFAAAAAGDQERAQRLFEEMNANPKQDYVYRAIWLPMYNQAASDLVGSNIQR